MAKEPTFAVFRCEKCGETFQAKARRGIHLLPWEPTWPIQANGVCRYCQGDRWTISVVFVESEHCVGESLLGLGLLALIGFGFYRRSTVHQSKYNFQNVSAESVALLNKNPRERLSCTGEFVRSAELANRKAQGYGECSVCGMMFLPTPGVPWAEKGYCSLMCLIEAEGASEPDPDVERTIEIESARSNSIQIQCASGHRFNVHVSFSGLTRRCPVCGQKTSIP